MKEELDWVRKNPKGRQARVRPDSLALKKCSHESSSLAMKRTKSIFRPVNGLGERVIEFENVSKAFGEHTLIDDLSFSVPRGAIVGIIGGNGAGKTTLFRMIAGEESPDNGNVTIGETVNMAFVEQSRENLDDSKTVWEAVSDGQDILKIGNFEMPSRAYIGSLTSEALISKNASAIYPAVNAAVFTWPTPCARAPMSCCSMSHPMISMLRPCVHLKKPFWPSRVVYW